MFHIEGMINGKSAYIGSNDGNEVKLQVGARGYTGDVEALQSREKITTGRIGLIPNTTDHNYLNVECAAYIIAGRCFDKGSITKAVNDYHRDGGVH
jgi:hypothetical protein